MRPQTARELGLLAVLLVAGGLCGIGVRHWIGGLNAQHAQLERCILSSRQSHQGQNARSMLAHLGAEVRECMHGAGYEQALNNPECGPAYWQGDVFCYLPNNSLGRLIYRIEASAASKKMRDAGKAAHSPSVG